MIKKFTDTFAALGAAAVLGTGVGLAPAAEAQQEGMLAEIRMFGGNFAPRGWALCDGQLLAISQNSALFSLLGTTYGGDGRTTFALPDLRGRTAVHPGTGPGLAPVRLGQQYGSSTVVLSEAQLPSHSHSATGTVRATDGRGTTTSPVGNTLANDSREDQYADAAPSVDMAADSVAVTVNSAGGGQPFNVTQPSLAINHIIATQGLFPSRN